MTLLDRLAARGRWRTVPAAEKGLVALGMLAVCLTAPPVPAGGLALLALTALAVGPAGVPWRPFLAVLAVPLGLLAATLPLLLVAVTWDGGPQVAWAADGPERAAALMGRAAGGAAALAFLATTTPVGQVLGLLRRWRVPAAVLEVALVTYAQAGTLMTAAVRGHRAQAARLGTVGVMRRLRSAGMLAAGLLRHGLHHARALETGLAARGYRGPMPTLDTQRRARPTRLLAGAAAVAAHAAAAVALGGGLS